MTEQALIRKTALIHLESKDVLFNLKYWESEIARFRKLGSNEKYIEYFETNYCSPFEEEAKRRNLLPVRKK